MRSAVPQKQESDCQRSSLGRKLSHALATPTLRAVLVSRFSRCVALRIVSSWHVSLSRQVHREGGAVAF